ncbi:MAG: hypothetical protein ABTQ29_06165, partial [Siculibacillus sp.]
TPPRMAEVARIRAAWLALDLEERAAVEARVAPLAAAASPWRGLAREVLALSAWKAGDVAATAARVSEVLDDPDTPRDLADRIAVLRALVDAQGPAGKVN